MMIDDDGWIALHSACGYNNSRGIFTCYNGISYDAIRMLVDVGRKDLIMVNNKDGNTALHFYAIMSSSTKGSRSTLGLLTKSNSFLKLVMQIMYS